MKMSKRLDEALNKLYNAFNNGTLNAECCKNCAVGNICDNSDSWRHLSDNHGSRDLNYVGLVHQNIGRRFYGYTPLELLNIETEFLKGCGYKLPLNHKNRRPKDSTSKEILFGGLCAAIDYLCLLDGVPNVMENYQDLKKGINKNRCLEAIN